MISVAIPCYRSQNTIEKVVMDLIGLFEEHRDEYQIVLVNDGSSDETFHVIKRLSNNNPNIVAVNLSKNYGQHAARMAAVPFLKGDFIVYMDDDGQHPVEGIYAMLDKLIEGDYDVVYALFKHKKHSLFKRISSAINTATLNILIGKPKDVKNSSFSIMRKFVLDEMVKYKSPFPSFSGFIMQVTHNIANVELEHEERIAGASNYTLRRMIKLYINSLTGFSVVPLRLASLFGSCVASIGFIAMMVTIIRKFIHPEISAGYTSLLSVILIVGGMIMMMLGVMGEYLGRMYMIENNMPQYSIREVVGVEHTINE